MKFYTETIRTNFYRQELDYISSLVDVRFSQVTSNYDVTFTIGNAPLGDAQTNWRYSGDYITHADMIFKQPFATQKYLFLHEMGHVLGLDHHGTSLSETLMVDGATVNANYTRSQVDAITQYTHSDIIDLWGKYGVSTQYTGNIYGDARNNTLYGGTSATDSIDGAELLAGASGSDIVFGNGGNDTIYGGSGQSDLVDGNDTIYGGYGDDLIYANAGADVIYGGAGADTIYSGIGADIIYYDKFDVILGFSPDDILILI